MACPSTSSCVAGDGSGDAVQGDPAVGGGWTLDPILRAHRLTDVSCASASQCVAVDSAGEAFVGPGRVTTGSSAGATGFGKGHARLSFALTAASHAAGIHVITVALPAEMGFSALHRDLVGAIRAKAGAKKLKLIAKVSHGKLTITLGAGVPHVQVMISAPRAHRHEKARERCQGGKGQAAADLPHHHEREAPDHPDGAGRRRELARPVGDPISAAATAQRSGGGPDAERPRVVHDRLVDGTPDPLELTIRPLGPARSRAGRGRCAGTGWPLTSSL